MNLIDLTGMKFGRLTVISRGEDAINKNGRHRARWNCVCDCGKNVLVYGDNLRDGKSTSCGCITKEVLSSRQKTHGDSNKHLYWAWKSIKARCYNKNTRYYNYYGGRGIQMCDEWKNSYEAFRDWAYTSGYTQGLSIDRIDNDDNYSPANCRWVTRDVQANNKRNNIMVEHEGITHNVTEWCNLLGLKAKTIFTRIYAGHSPEEAIFENTN